MTVHAAKGLEFDRVIMPNCNERVYPHGTMLDAATVEEERRIFYVGMTRAKSRLEFTYIKGTREHPEDVSRFLDF
jgi:DNA helicase-2/ATP-dependent DNA helicase PcrA